VPAKHFNHCPWAHLPQYNFVDFVGEILTVIARVVAPIEVFTEWKGIFDDPDERRCPNPNA
jgi:hypothetical protein